MQSHPLLRLRGRVRVGGAWHGSKRSADCSNRHFESTSQSSRPPPPPSPALRGRESVVQFDCPIRGFQPSVSAPRKATMSRTSAALSGGASPGWPPNGGLVTLLA